MDVTLGAVDAGQEERATAMAAVFLLVLQLARA
jgi:hypothetical protein